MFGSRYYLYSLVFLLFLCCLLAGCAPVSNPADDDNNDASPADDDDDDNDNDNIDASPSDDDDDDNDNDDNDDNNDNDDNDDNDNDDNNDDSSLFGPSTIITGDLTRELVTGGHLLATKRATAVGPNGEFYYTVTHGRFLRLIEVVGDVTTGQTLDADAGPAQLAVDQAGALHLLYSRSDEQVWYYLTNRPGKWQRETVSGTYFDFNTVSFAVEANGIPHFAVSDHDAGGLLHFQRDEAGWRREVITAEPVSRYALALADGVPQVVSLRLAPTGGYFLVSSHREFGVWNEQTLGWLPASLLGPSYYGIDIKPDPAGVLHLAVGFSYYDFMGNGYHYVFYAQWAAGVWSATRILRPGAGAWNLALTCDAAGHTFIYYGDYELNQLSDETGDWLQDTIAEETGDDLSATAAAAGGRQVVYVNQRLESLRLVEVAAAAAEPVTVFASADSGYSNSLVVAPDDTLYFAFLNLTADSYLLAAPSAKAWQLETIAVSPEHLYYPYDYPIQLRRGGDGILQAMYIDFENNNLDLAKRAPLEWQVETVAGTGMQRVSFVADEGGHTHAAWFDFNTSELVYANNSDGSWAYHTLAVFPSLGYVNPVLAIDADGKAHIATDHPGAAGEPSSVAYYTNRSGSWTEEIVDSGEGVGSYDSLAIALDSDGEPHLAGTTVVISNYRGLLKYFWKNDDGWQHEIVLEAGADSELLGDCSLSLDAQDSAHLGFCRDCGYGLAGSIQYVTNRDGAWQFRQIDDLCATGVRSNHLALDSLGQVRVSYYCDGGLWLATFPLDAAQNSMP